MRVGEERRRGIARCDGLLRYVAGETVTCGAAARFWQCKWK